MAGAGEAGRERRGGAEAALQAGSCSMATEASAPSTETSPSNDSSSPSGHYEMKAIAIGFVKLDSPFMMLRKWNAQSFAPLVTSDMTIYWSSPVFTSTPHPYPVGLWIPSNITGCLIQRLPRLNQPAKRSRQTRRLAHDRIQAATPFPLPAEDSDIMTMLSLK